VISTVSLSIRVTSIAAASASSGATAPRKLSIAARARLCAAGGSVAYGQQPSINAEK
jgi:hypothetical protein